MARLFPLRSETPAREGRPRVVDLEDEDADAVFGALSSTTARRIYARLNDEPGTASDVAEAIDSSIQNVRYHLEKLEDAGLVEVVDTWYSSRGNEMSVYAAADGPLIVTSDESRASQLREALSRFLGGVAIVGMASLLVQYAASELFAPQTEPTGGAGEEAAPAGDDGGDAEPTGTEDEREGGTDDVGIAENPEDESTGGGQAEDGPETTSDGYADGGDGAANDGATPSPDDGGSDGLLDAALDATTETVDGFATLVSPGLAFFLGGVLVLAIVTLWWYRTQRPAAN